MPQLDPSSFSSQLFWLVLSFVLLYIIVVRRIVPLTYEVLQYRRDKISNDLDNAVTLRDEAEQIEKTYMQSLDKTHAKASDVVGKANAKIIESSAKKHAELDSLLQAQAVAAEEKIVKAHAQAVAEISNISATLALEIVSKLTDIKVSEKQAEATVKHFVS